MEGDERDLRVVVVVGMQFELYNARELIQPPSSASAAVTNRGQPTNSERV